MPHFKSSVFNDNIITYLNFPSSYFQHPFSKYFMILKDNSHFLKYEPFPNGSPQLMQHQGQEDFVIVIRVDE